MRRLLFLVSLSVLPALAVAQGMGGGGPPPQMPDPRQMSGHPRPDQQVPTGVITVKVIRGELSALAPVGTPVHLVAVATGGKTSMTTLPVNAEGRAEFKNLVTDGSVVYYALCLDGEDRLTSDPIAPPPHVGVRLMLASRKVGPDQQPIGPAIDDERPRDDEKSPDVDQAAAGVVDVVVRGPGGEKLAVLRELGSSEQREAKLDATAQAAHFEGVAGGPDKVYIAQVPSGLRTFVTTPFMMAPAAGVRRMILAYDRLLFALQGGAQADEESFGVELQLVLANMTGAPFDTGGGILIPLPDGFTHGVLKDEDPAAQVAVVPGEGVRFSGAMAPGQRTIVVQFTLPIVDGRTSFDLAAPLGLFQSQIYILKSGAMVVAPGSGITTAPQLQRSDDGREYVQLTNLTISPGQHLRFDVAGLPIPARWPVYARGLAGLVVAVIVVIALMFAIRRPRAPMRSPATRDDERRDLVALRERLYAELITIERARAARRIDPDAFAVQRRGIMTRLVLVHRQLDDLDDPAGATERSAAGES